MTYRTVEHILTLVAALLDVAFERAVVEGLEQFEGAEQLRGDAHDGAPIIEFAAVLFVESALVVQLDVEMCEDSHLVRKRQSPGCAH